MIALIFAAWFVAGVHATLPFHVGGLIFFAWSYHLLLGMGAHGAMVEE
jgi:hypothetical protein